MLGVGSAFGAEVEDRDHVLVLVLPAVVFLDLPLDRQAVTVPAGDVVGVVARHLAGAVDHVLVDLVERGAEVDVAVGIGRAVVKDEQRAAGGGGAQLGEQVGFIPFCEDAVFFRQVATHRKAGLRQEDRVAVVALGIVARFARGVSDGVFHRGFPKRAVVRRRYLPRMRAVGPCRTCKVDPRIGRARPDRMAGGDAAPEDPSCHGRSGRAALAWSSGWL